MRDSTFKLGDYNLKCDRCGLKIKASTARKTWDGYYVCPEHWEPRQSLDYLKGIKDVQSVPFSRPDILSPTLLKTTSYTLLNSDASVFCDASSAPITITLPAVPANYEQHYVAKVDGTSNAVTVGSVYVLTKPNSGVNVQYVNGTWTVTSVLPSES